MIYFWWMEKCLQCLNLLVHVPGRKQKSFCDVNCRNKYFYAQRKKQIEDAKALLVSLPVDYVEIKKVGVLTTDGKVKPLVFPKPVKKAKKTQNLDSQVPFKEIIKESFDAPKLENVNDESIPEWKRLLEARRNQKNNK